MTLNQPNDIAIHETYAEIIIYNEKYGDIKTLIDLEDIEKLTRITWGLYKRNAKSDTFYIRASIQGKDCRLHRLLMNCPKGLVVDHINHNTLDNRKSNLRVCTNRENLQNRKLDCRNKTGITGIYKTDKKYLASICFNYKLIHLGLFDHLSDAVKVRKEAELKYFTHIKTA